MRQIRNNVFETNSSSTHSLVVSKAEYDHLTHDEMLKSLCIKDGKYHMPEDCYFGRSPFRILSEFNEKINYAYANGLTEVVDIVKELVPEVIDFEFCTYAGVDDYLLHEWLGNLNIDLKEFLTNPNIIVICDGDEYCYWNKLKDTSLIDANFFTEV